jgi:hypothetical protein
MNDQAEFIRHYNETHREEFNPVLFQRDDYEVIEALKKVILSCQRDKYFTIKVTGFRVVEDYEEIADILYNHEQEKIDRNKNNAKKSDNPYQYIDLKDSDIMLLIIDYYIAVNRAPDEIIIDEKTQKREKLNDTLQVIIEVPRIVEKYYYRIGGNLFSAIYQIVDGSTYNNSASNSKKQSVTFKTVFMPTRLYRYTADVHDYNDQKIKCIFYKSRIFNKTIYVMEYFLAKFGLYETIDFFGLKFINFTDYYVGDPDTYTFEKNGIFIEVPKYIFDNDIVTQCMVISIHKGITRTATIRDIKTKKYWLEILSNEFTSKYLAEKGLSILDSLESIYDIDTYESIRLPEEDKKTIYHILRWMIREFPSLRLKDNIDISTKRIRRAEYIASIYAIKISKGIYRASDIQKKITVDEIKRYIYVEPSFLIDKVVKDKLVGFRNSVNDNDAITALKYSYKGISGLGEQRGSTIPDKYRYVHYSHLGRVDVDASSATDPGLTGIICPLAKIYDQSFSEYQEPNEWSNDFNELMAQYRAMVGTRQLVKFQEELGDIFDIANKSVTKEQLDNIDSCIEQQKIAIDAISNAEQTTEYYDADQTEDGDIIIYKN